MFRAVLLISSSIVLYAETSLSFPLDPQNKVAGISWAVERGFGALPLRFEPNFGQVAAEARYLARGAGYAICIEPIGATMVFRQNAGDADSARGSVVRLRFVAANPRASFSSVGRLPGVSHYITGRDRSRWMARVPHFSRVEAAEVYSGIDVAYYGSDRRLEYDFVLSPGADPDSICLRFDGVTNIAIDSDGNLILDTANVPIRQRAPLAYQRASDGSHQPVRVAYTLDSEQRVKFDLGPYDPDRELVIDPIVDYATLLGGDAQDLANDVAVDGSGAMYLTGHTSSTDFPTKAGGFDVTKDASDAFVTKISPDGRNVIYSTYLGGPESEGGTGHAIVVDDLGRAHIGGSTLASYYVTPNAVQEVGERPAFAMRLSADGSDVEYGTLFTGAVGATIRDIAVSDGLMYVVGDTDSTDLPIRGGFQTNAFGGSEAFVAVFDPDAPAVIGGVAESLVYSTYLGGSGDDFGRGIAMFGPGNVVVTGATRSTSVLARMFPTRNAIQNDPGASAMTTAFVTGIATRVAGPGSLTFSTFLGGSAAENDGEDDGGIATDAAGTIWVVGSTRSLDFPVSEDADQGKNLGERDAFVARIGDEGTGLEYATYLGGQSDDYAVDVEVDTAGDVHVVGDSASSSFPLLDPVQSAAGSFDAFLALYSGNGSRIHSTLYGGDGRERVGGVAVRAPGASVFAGSTREHTVSRFPTTEGAIQSTFWGSSMAFVVAIGGDSSCPEDARLEGVTPKLVSTAGGDLSFLGEGFTDEVDAYVGDQLLESPERSDERIAGFLPALPAGVYDASLRCGGEILSVLEDAVVVAPPPILEGVEPNTFPLDGGVAVEVIGGNFRGETVVRLGDVPLANPLVAADGRSIRGVAPAQAAPGQYDVVATDSRGVSRLEGAVTYFAFDPCDGEDVRIDGVSPDVIEPLVETAIDVRGAGFVAEHSLRLESGRVVSASVESPELIRANIDGVEPGLWDVELLCPTGAVVARLRDALEARRGAPSLTRVEPHEVQIEGGDSVDVFGENLTEDTVIFFAHRPLRDARLVEGREETFIRGIAPVGDVIGPVDVTARDPAGDFVLEGGVRYVREGNHILGPEQGEASLAEGTARFSWYNPVAFERIEVLDEGGNLIDELDGEATAYRSDAGDRESITYSFVGYSSADQASAELSLTAVAQDCDTPPPLSAVVQALDQRLGGLEYADVEFSLYGAHSEADSDRCAEPGGVLKLAAADLPPRTGALEPGVGNISRPNLPDAKLPQSEAVTGFSLENPATKLEFAVHYRKLAVAAGVRLRGHLIQTSPDSGFEDEFSFPPVNISATNDWHVVTYFRADSDIGRELEGPNDPGPRPCGGGECAGAEIPAGDYVLKLYAVSGDRQIPYYALSSNPEPDELLIPGTPCPPYPLVRVRDVSGEATLPLVSGLHCGKLEGVQCSNDDVRVRVTALGFWLDECNQTHSLEPVDPRFEFQWKIYTGSVPRVIPWSHRNWFEACLACGCYEVEISVRQTGCPTVLKYTRELVVTPPNLACNPSRRFEFLYPQPSPAGLDGIIGLNPPDGRLGLGSADERPLEFQILVSPNTTCGGPGTGSVDKDDIEFDIGIPGTNTFRMGIPFEVTDGCPNTIGGSKYFRVRIADLGAVPYHPALESFNGTQLWVIGHAKGTNEPWQSFSGTLRLYNPPACLATNSWRGTWEEPGCYRFETRSSEQPEQRFSMGPSLPIDIDLPELGDGGAASINVEGHSSNAVQGGFTSQFTLEGGVWSEESGVGGMRGGMMGNDITGAPLEVEPSSGAAKRRWKGADGDDDDDNDDDKKLPSWEWCDGGNLFNYEFKEDLYSGVIYQGTIWVIPVSIWANIGFGFFLNIDYQLTFKLHPFAIIDGFDAVCDAFDVPPCNPLEGCNPFEPDSCNINFENCKISLADAWMYLLVQAGINIPASIRADILFGVASVAITVKPEASFHITPWIEAHAQLPDPVFAPHMDLGARFKLFASLKACIFWGLQCISIPDPVDTPIIDEPIFECPNPPFDCVSPNCIEVCEEDEEGDKFRQRFFDKDRAARLAGRQDKGGAGTGIFKIHEVVSIPETFYSPDGGTYVDVWMSAEEGDGGALNVRRVGDVSRDYVFTLGGPNPFFLDPSGAFITDDIALIAFTQSNPNLMMNLPALDIDDPGPHVDASNHNAAVANIRVHALTPTTSGSAQLISSGEDVSEASVNQASWRADGMASMAGMPGASEAWLAWVRYNDEFLEDKGTREIRVYCTPPGCRSGRTFETEVVRDLQPTLNRTGVYVRRITYTEQDGVHAVPGSSPMEVSTVAGINIEPEVAALRDGSAAVCVWVHNGQHENMTDDNRGWNLHFSRWERTTGQWSAPVDVVDSAILADYPGILEPRVVVKPGDAGRFEGLLAFTAVPPGAEPNDTGLGGLRFLYTLRFREEANGTVTFDTPIRIRGRCDAPIYVWDYEFGYELDVFAPSPEDDLLFKYGPEAVIVFQCRGVPGTRASAGDVMVTALPDSTDEWSPPVCVTGSDRTITNTVASVSPIGGVHAVYLDQGASIEGFAAEIQQNGRVAAIQGIPPRGYQTIDCALDPDLALVRCDLSHQFAGPGSTVTARVRVENRGLAGSAVDSGGNSLSGVQILYYSDDPEFRDDPGRVVAALELPEIPPGMTHDLTFEIEMPHDPVRLEARVFPNPIDRDDSNNKKSCDFGAPRPLDLFCQARIIEDSERGENIVAVLEWQNPVKYEEMLVYRDQKLIASIPGSVERFVDIEIEETVNLGVEHVYSIRGCLGVSRSSYATCALQPPIESSGDFRRGDANADGAVNISDPIFGLNRLFGDGEVLPCLESGDVNADAAFNIADPIFLLNNLFGDGPSPVEGHGARGFDCGPDPDPESSLGCDLYDKC